MTETEVLQKLDSIREESDQIVNLFVNDRIAQVQVAPAQERFRILKERLKAEYDRMNTAKGEAAMSEAERHFYQPAINDSLHNTGLSRLRWNSPPSKDWFDALCGVSSYMAYWRPTPDR